MVPGHCLPSGHWAQRGPCPVSLGRSSLPNASSSGHREGSSRVHGHQGWPQTRSPSPRCIAMYITALLQDVVFK